MEATMSDTADLVKEAEAIAKRAEQETDLKVRDRLLRMAGYYRHLAESKNWSASHPPSAGSLAEIFTAQKR
jgi:hypothetical protein